MKVMEVATLERSAFADGWQKYEWLCNMQQSYWAGIIALEERVRSYRLARRGDSKQLDVLELGCGTGQGTVRLLQAIGRSDMTVVDSGAQEVPLAKAKAQSSPHQANAVFVIGDVKDFLDSSVRGRRTWDVIASSFTLHNWRNEYRRQTLSLVYRALRPDGLFCNADYYPRNAASSTEAFRAHVEGLFDICTPSGEIALLRRWVAHTIEDMAPSRIMCEDAACEMLEELGFTAIEVDRVSELTAVVSAKAGN